MKNLLLVFLAAAFIGSGALPRAAHGDGLLPNLLFQGPSFYPITCPGGFDCLCPAGDVSTGGGADCAPPFGGIPLVISRPIIDTDSGSAVGWHAVCLGSGGAVLPAFTLTVQCVHQ